MRPMTRATFAASVTASLLMKLPPPPPKILHRVLLLEIQA